MPSGTNPISSGARRIKIKLVGTTKNKAMIPSVYHASLHPKVNTMNEAIGIKNNPPSDIPITDIARALPRNRMNHLETIVGVTISVLVIAEETPYPRPKKR
jgi:hypothetical protein